MTFWAGVTLSVFLFADEESCVQKEPTSHRFSSLNQENTEKALNQNNTFSHTPAQMVKCFIYQIVFIACYCGIVSTLILAD